MPQGLMLLKQLPDENYLHDLQERGIFRASMSFLPGGCYAAAGLFDSTRSYVTTSGDAPLPEAMCPDAVNCDLYEILARIRKVSGVGTEAFGALVLLALLPGSGDRFMEQVLRTSGNDSEELAYYEGPRGLEYVAAGHLLGCGSYNAVVEVVASDHLRVQEVVRELTDLDCVREYSLGRFRAQDCRGFGEGLEELD